MTAISAVALGLGLLLGSVRADKDDSYYIAGTGNPNKDEKMYWKDAENIFQDLSEFQSLYVEFHNCAWTWMMVSDQDNDIDENDYWYMGKIPPMGANVAYSLYGSLYGETFEGCSEDTFINSFYTNSGFTNFARAMSYAGLSGFNNYAYDDDSSGSYTAWCGGGYGVGCDYSNGFAVHTYSGDECNPANYTGVSDKMSNLNQAMESAQCIQIYDASSYSGSPYGTPLELLAYSHSCFYQDFFSPDGVCPDPYGKLASYQQQFYSGIQESKKKDPYQVSKRKKLYNNEIRNGKIMTLAGIGLAALAFLIIFYECAVACFGYKEAKMREWTPRKDDFMIKARGEDMESSPTVGEKSDTSSENVVTMSHEEPYIPPVNTPVASPPLQKPHPPHVPSLTVPPSLATLPSQTTGATMVVPPAQPALSAIHVDVPRHSGGGVTGVDMAPSAVPPRSQVAATPMVDPPPAPGNKTQVSVQDSGAPVSLHGCPSIGSKTLVPEKDITADAKEKDNPTIVSLKSEERAPEPAQQEEANREAPVQTPSGPEHIESLAAQVEELTKLLAEVKGLAKETSSVTAETSPRVFPEVPAPEAPPLVEAPSLKSLADDYKPLFSDIHGSSSNLSPTEDTNKGADESIPSIGEIVASHESFSDVDNASSSVLDFDGATETELMDKMEEVDVSNDAGKDMPVPGQEKMKEAESAPAQPQRSGSWLGL